MKALVLGCTVNSGLAVMRSLHSAGVVVIGADSRRMPLNLHSNCARLYEQTAPVHSMNFATSLYSLLELHQPEVLLPGGAAGECSQAKDFLSRSTNLLIPDFESFQAVNDKRCIVEQCRKSGILTPELLDTETARKLLQSRQADAVIIKPRENYGGGRGVSIVSEIEQFDRLMQDNVDEYGELLISEFVPGPDENNIELQILFDRESRLIGHFAQQKLRLQPPRVGISAASVSVHRPDLVQSILPMFTRLRWQGPADVEFKLDSRTGDAQLIEVNARFSGGVGFPIACGVDLPLLSYRSAMGEILPEVLTPEYRAGVKYCNPVMYARAIVAAIRNGDSLVSMPRQIYAELGGERVGNPYRLSDPAPLVGKTLLQILEWISPESRR